MNTPMRNSAAHRIVAAPRLARGVSLIELMVALLIGVILGTIVVALASVGSYDRGFQDGARHFILEP